FRFICGFSDSPLSWSGFGVGALAWALASGGGSSGPERPQAVRPSATRTATASARRAEKGEDLADKTRLRRPSPYTGSVGGREGAAPARSGAEHGNRPGPHSNPGSSIIKGIWRLFRSSRRRLRGRGGRNVRRPRTNN